jgi:hypothetical protein
MFLPGKKRKGYIFHSPETFQSLFGHTDGKIRDGYGEDTDPAFALSVI